MGFITALCVKISISIGGTVQYLRTVPVNSIVDSKFKAKIHAFPLIGKKFESKLFKKLHDFFGHIARRY
jgi:hypothetical protein